MKHSQMKRSHTDKVEPPAIESVVNTNREEVIQTGSMAYKYEEANPNPEVASTDGRYVSEEAGKLDNLIQEAETMNVDILGISETRWTDTGFTEKKNHIFIHSGGAKHERGVAFLIKKELQKYIIGYWTVNERCILLKIKAKPFDIAIIQIYAPTQDWSDEKIESFYENIQNTIKQLKSTDVLMVIGDFNAKVGNESYKDIVGKYGLGKKNDRGDRLIEFCEENKLVISNTMFQQPKRRLYTWKSPGDWTRNQIDYFLIRKRFKNSVVNIRTYPGADINSDHSPVIANMHIKLKKATTKSKKVAKYDLEALKVKEIQKKYLVEVRNKYEALLESQEQVQFEVRENCRIERKWEYLKTSIHHGCSTTLLRKEKTAKQPWMTEEILQLMEDRKHSKNSPKYHVLDKEIDRRCRKAKEHWLNSKCDKIEQLELENRTRDMHQEVKSLTNDKKKNNRSGSIKSKDGRMLFDTDDITERWTEYVQNLFKDERPEERPKLGNNEGACILKEEITAATKSLKNGKACGPDEISAEMLRALGDFGVDRITEICNDIYNTGYLPEDMRKSVFITIPKKAHAVECSDYRTISLMSHVTKLLLRIILKRIKNRIDREISEEQFGFRDQRGTREAIFNMKMIMEKHIETWTISKKMEERLEAYEMWIYRRIGKVSWTERKTNEYVLRMLGIKKQLLNIVKERKLKYYGHIKRHQTVQRTTLEGKVEGKRSRGKQRLKWEDNIKGRPTDLQIALGVLLRDSKELLCHMYDYRVTCSYDELLRFKKSAAVAAAGDLTQQEISDSTSELVQVDMCTMPDMHSITYDLCMAYLLISRGNLLRDSIPCTTHNTGLFNGIWSDMAIETTFMRYGYSKSGIVGITLKPETLKTWAYSLHTCHGILDDLDEMRETYRSPCKTTHKEETAAKIQDLIEHKETFQQHTLIVTGSDPVPIQIANGRVSMRVDMTTTQEESDSLIIQQVAHVTDSTVLVVADDTDIFILLLYFCHRGDISSKVLMVSPVQGRAVLDINAAVEVHKLIIPDLLAAHGLTGCDTVASCYGIGKRVALKVLRSNKHKLNYLGNTDVDLIDVVEQATHFMIACYGQPGCSLFTEAQTKLWSRKFGRSKVTAPTLCALPPTTEAFKENVARAHLQVAIWLHALDQYPPSLEPNEHGWSQEEGSNVHNPITVPADIFLPHQSC
ncbi:Craniofacial development protein 2 [Nymphon striatum]|nr:Craniofacial development protein 2 [Nymphon striatum]